MKNVLTEKMAQLVTIVPAFATLALLCIFFDAWVYSVGYEQLFVPIAQSYGYTPVDIDYHRWVGIVALLFVIRYELKGTKKSENLDGMQGCAMILGRILTMLGLVVLCYLINWLFL
jgi:hypothetical protein